jgi:anti-anti-sigma factor
MTTSTGFAVRLRRTSTGTRVELSGCLDLAVCHNLAATLHRALEGAPATVEVDMGSLRFLDAAGISTLIQAQQLARELGSDLFVTNSTGIVRMVMVITDTLTGLGTPIRGNLAPVGPADAPAGRPGSPRSRVRRMLSTLRSKELPRR